MSWLDLAKMEAERATERVHESEVLWGLACEAYDKDPCKANAIALNATIQMVKDAKAQEAEWHVT